MHATTPPATRLRRRLRTGLGVGAMALALAAALPAAQPVPAAPDQASIEAQNRVVQQQARQSLDEKLAAGRARYQERLALRQTLVTSLRSTATEQRRVILAQLEAAAQPAPEPLPARSRTAPAWLLAAAIVCVLIGLGWQWRFRERAG